MVIHRKSPKKSHKSPKKSKKSPKKSRSSKSSPKKHHGKVVRRKDRVGTKIQVWSGTKEFTAGGLMKKHLIENRKGKIVSKAMSERAKKNDNLGDYRIPAKRSRSPKKSKRSPKKSPKKSRR